VPSDFDLCLFFDKLIDRISINFHDFHYIIHFLIVELLIDISISLKPIDVILNNICKFVAIMINV